MGLRDDRPQVTVRLESHPLVLEELSKGQRSPYEPADRSSRTAGVALRSAVGGDAATGSSRMAARLAARGVGGDAREPAAARWLSAADVGDDEPAAPRGDRPRVVVVCMAHVRPGGYLVGAMGAPWSR